jgi:hypothetical protein
VCEIGRTGNESRTLASSGDYEIGCTANHPFWSEDRQEFVEAGQLREGERVRTRLDEIAHVVQVKPRPPTKWVYNLEIQGEHVYEVGPGGVLVHNACQQVSREIGRLSEKISASYYKRKGYTIMGAIQNRSGHGIDLVVRKRGELIFVEVKTNSARLSKAQAQGGRSFVRDRLRRVLDRQHPKHGFFKNVDEQTKRLARYCEQQIKNGTKTIKYRVVRVRISDGSIVETPW